MVLPATPGGSPAAGKRQVNIPLTRNNDLPCGFLASADSVTDPVGPVRLGGSGIAVDFVVLWVGLLASKFATGRAGGHGTGRAGATDAAACKMPRHGTSQHGIPE